MIYADNILNYPDWTIMFTVHTDASDKQSSSFISQNIKPIALLFSRLRNMQCK